MTNPARPDGPAVDSRHLLVIGAGPGLGGAIAHRFAQDGYHLTLLARRTDGLAKLASDLTDAGAAVASYLTAHLATARLIGRQALTGLALAHGYDTAFWWTVGIFAAGAVTAGALLRPGPLRPASTPPPAHAEVTTAQAKADPALPG